MRRKRTGLFAVVVSMLLATVLAFTLVGCGEEKTYSASLSVDGANMKVGESITVTVDADYDLGEVAWATSDAAVATVDAGKITAVGTGTADVTATTTDPAGKEHKLVCSVYVTAADVTEASYKIEVYRQKKDRTGYELDTAASEEKTAAVDKSVSANAALYGKTGYVFDENNTGNVLSGTVASDNNTVLKLYYNIKTFTVTFKADGEEDVVRTVDYGDTLTDIPAVPEKTGKDGRWNVTSFAEITSDMEVTAIYSTKVLTLTFVADDVTVRTYEISYGGSFNEIPAVPEKVGYTGAWDTTDLDNITENTTVTAVYTLKVLSVTYLNGDDTYHTDNDINAFSKLTAPETDPTQAADTDFEYDFAGWRVKGTHKLWDFENDEITDNLVLEAVYNPVALYTITVTATGEKVDIDGVNAPLFVPTAEQLTGVAAGVIDRGDITVKVENGVVSFRARSGEYTVRVSKGNYTTDVVVSVNDANATAYAYLIPQDVKVGGKSGEHESFGQKADGTGGTNWTKNAADSVTLTAASWVHIDATEEEYSTRYYYEADLTFSNVGKVVGFMPAHDVEGVTGQNNGFNKLGFCFSGGSCTYWHKSTGWTYGTWGTNTDQFTRVFYADAENHKFAVLREGNDYYLLINDKVIANYVCSDFGASSFGFFSIDGNCRFDNIRYTRNVETLDAIYEYVTETSQLGGSVVYSDNSKIDSFSADWYLTGKDSGRIGLGNGPSYIINGGKAGSIYYAEAEFTTSSVENWVGIMINTSDKAPCDTGLWYGYGMAYGQLFRHSTADWASGDPLGSFPYEKTFKLGVARINDRYYVFLNDTLIASEQYRVLSGKDRSNTLAADNESGFGIFIGSNTEKDATFKDFKCTTDLAKIAKIVGSSTVAFDSEVVEVKQLGKAVGENGSVIGGVPVEFTVTPAEGQAIGDIVLTFNGERVTPSYENSKYVFTPVAGGKYEITVTYVEQGTGSLDLTVKSVTKTVGDTEYALYDNIDPTAVEVSILNMSTGAESTANLDSLNKSYDLAAGYYVVEVRYANNVYTYNVTVEKDKATSLVGFVSSTYLGGTITINNSAGEETTYKSYNNADVNATKGQAWALVNGRRDTVKLTGYTYVFQNQAVGTKYYLEGTFDANQTYNFADHIAGLLIAHGPDNLADSSDVKLVAGIREKNLVVASIPTGWDPADTRILARLDEVFPNGYDPAKVKLGVIRDGKNYYFFLNDVYVCNYYYDLVSTVSGMGLTASNSLEVTVSNFNYSMSETLIDAMKALAPATEEKAIDLFFIAGQSNGTGYSTFNYETAKEADENLVYGFSHVLYAGDRDSVLDPDKSRTLGWQYTRMGLGGQTNRFGAEAGMAQSLSTYYNAASGKTAGIIKSAHGGTSLLDGIGGQNEPGGNWVSPSYEATITAQEPGGRTGGCYRSFIEQVKLNVAQLKAMGYTEINFKGLFWMQGESDRGNPAEYLKAFKFLVKDFRDDLGEIAGTDLSRMPIVVGEISKYTGGEASAMNDTFIATQRSFPDEVNDCYVVNSSPYDVRKQDNWHWIQADMITIGNLVGDCIKTNILK